MYRILRPHPITFLAGACLLVITSFLYTSTASASPIVYTAGLTAEEGKRIDLETGDAQPFAITSGDVASSFTSRAMAVSEGSGTTTLLTTYNTFVEGTLTEFIIRMNPDGSGVERLVELPERQESIEGLAVSDSTGWIYWIESSGTSDAPSRLMTADSDGSDIQEIDSVQGGFIDGLIIDPQREKLLYLKDDGSTTRIIRANLDGFGKETAVEGFFIAVSDLALHVQSNTIYWSLAGWKGVERLPLKEGEAANAGSAEKLFEDTALGPVRDILISQEGDGKLIYSFAELLTTRELDGSNPQTVTAVAMDPMIAVSGAAGPPDPFDGEPIGDEPDGWRSSWLGNYSTEFYGSTNFVFHEDLQWAHVQEEDKGTFLYVKELNSWSFTNRDFYPGIYIFADDNEFTNNTWAWFSPDAKQPLWFYNLEDKLWSRHPTQASIALRDQESFGQLLTVDQVTMSEGGFIAIYDKSPEFEDSRILGVSTYKQAGTWENLTITLDDPLSNGSSVVVGALHKDTNGNVLFDFVSTDGQEDGRYEFFDNPVVDSATIEVR